MKKLNILKLLETQLDGEQMKKFTSNKFNIIRYPQLNKINDIDKIFGKSNGVIIYFEVSGVNSGHWTCLMRRNNEYEMFDSYGLQIDGEFRYISKRVLLNEGFNRLSKLLNDKRKQGYKIIHNTYKLQKFDLLYEGKMTHPETCGRHTCLRLQNIDMNLDDFVLDKYVANHRLGCNSNGESFVKQKPQGPAGPCKDTPDDVIVCYLIN